MYELRWISKRRYDSLRKAGRLGKAMVLDSCNGLLIVEPAGSAMGDGAVLSPQEADYELQPVWCTGHLGELRLARRRLGLDVHEWAGSTV